MNNYFWRNCNKSCGYFDIEKGICKIKKYSSVPTLKCFLYQLCCLGEGILRIMESEHKDIVDGEDWKNRS